MKAIVRRFNGKKRLIIAGVAVLVLAMIAAYVLWGNAVWSDYHTSYDKRKSDMESSLQSALKMPSNTPKERTAKLQALIAVSTRFGSVNTSCDVNGAISWQQEVNQTYKKWKTECADVQASVGALDNKLGVATAYMKSERELAQVLSMALAATDKKVTEKSFSSIVDTWKTAASSVSRLGGPVEFTPVKSKTQKVVDAIVSAWRAVVAAHSAKDEAKFESALKALNGAYSELDGVESASTAELVKLSKEVQSQYERL